MLLIAVGNAHLEKVICETIVFCWYLCFDLTYIFSLYFSRHPIHDEKNQKNSNPK
jgi:hypothetical protein